MNKTDEIRYCENCGELIPVTRNKGSIYCTTKCGWTFRNRGNNVANKEKRIITRQLDINYKIVKDLYNKGKNNISIESLELLGFDFEHFTGVKKIAPDNQFEVIKLFEFEINIQNNRCLINKY